MAKTSAERVAAYRQRLKESGASDRLNIVATSDAVRILKLYADYNGVTQSEALHEIVAMFWAGVDPADKEKMAEHAKVLEEKKRKQQAGDIYTGNLFS